MAGRGSRCRHPKGPTRSQTSNRPWSLLTAVPIFCNALRLLGREQLLVNKGDLRHHYERFLAAVEGTGEHAPQGQSFGPPSRSDGDATEPVFEDTTADQSAELQQQWEALRKRGAELWAEAQRSFKRAACALPDCPLDAVDAAAQADVGALLDALAARSEQLGLAGEAAQARCSRSISQGSGGASAGGGGSGGAARPGGGELVSRKRAVVPLFKSGASLYCVGDCVSVNGDESDTPFIAQLLKYDRQTQYLTVRWLYRAEEVYSQVFSVPKSRQAPSDDDRRGLIPVN